MENVLTLSSLEEFELWLDSLAVYFEQDGKPVASKTPIPLNQNFRSELQSALKTIGAMLENCPRVIQEEVSRDSVQLGPDWDSSRDLRENVLQNPNLAKQMGGFIRLWDFLKWFNIIGHAIARHEKVTRQEFRAYGFILSEQVELYRVDESHQGLNRRSLYSKYYHILHRDILAAIEIEGTREELERVFLQFFKVLSTVQYFRTIMRRSFKYQQLTILLAYCRSTYSKLLAALEQAQQYLTYCQPELAEAVGTTKFALKIETRRIFGQELKGISSQQKLDAIYAQMETALGLLKNASQQSFTSLVQHLNPRFDEFALFDELRRQRTDSVQLLSDLNELHQIVQATEARESEQGFRTLLETLQRFQQGSMRKLYFKDWKPFEQFAEEFQTSEARERAFVLHRFEVYVSTLIGEVAKRAILQQERKTQETTDTVGQV